MATEELKNKLAESRTNKPKKRSLKSLIKIMEPQIAKALPSVITPERFTRIVMTAISSNPKLASCDANSFLGALMQSAQLGLEPNTPLGQAYLIPYGNKVQFQIGYKGLIDLAHRSGDFQTIYAMEVYENDDFEYEFGLEPKLYHKPATEDRGDVIFYYAVYTLTNGGFGFQVMSVDDVKKHAKKYSKAYNGGPWKTNFDEMAKKTVIKKVLKYAPVKTDFARGISQDETIKSEINEDMSIISDETNYEILDEEEIKEEDKELPWKEIEEA